MEWKKKNGAGEARGLEIFFTGDVRTIGWPAAVRSSDNGSIAAASVRRAPAASVGFCDDDVRATEGDVALFGRA